MNYDYSYMILTHCLNKELNECVEVLPLIKDYLNKKYWVRNSGEIFLEHTEGSFFMNSGDFYFIQAMNGLSKEEMIKKVMKWIEDKLKMNAKTVLPLRYEKKRI